MQAFYVGQYVEVGKYRGSYMSVHFICVDELLECFSISSEKPDYLDLLFFPNTWVKVFRANPEFRILWLTFHRKSATKC